MSTGLALYKADGSLIFDTNNRILRLIGQYTVTFPSGVTDPSISISIPGITNDGTWAVLLSSAMFAYTITPDTLTMYLGRDWPFYQVYTTVVIVGRF